MQRCTDKKGRVRSRYCKNHRAHERKHGHPIIKLPKKNDKTIHRPYLAGRLWVKRHKDVLSKDLIALLRLGEQSRAKRWVKTGKELKRLEAKHQFVFMISRVVERVGAVEALGRIMGTYNAWANTSLNWDLIHRPKAEPLYFSTLVFEGFWPTGYGNKQKRTMTYMGDELLRLAKIIDSNFTYSHQQWLKYSQYETLEQFNTRHKHWMQTPLPSVGSRGKFPRAFKPTEELKLGKKRMQQRNQMTVMLNELAHYTAHKES